jgi:hypothetical protein
MSLVGCFQFFEKWIFEYEGTAVKTRLTSVTPMLACAQTRQQKHGCRAGEAAEHPWLHCEWLTVGTSWELIWAWLLNTVLTAFLVLAKESSGLILSSVESRLLALIGLTETHFLLNLNSQLPNSQPLAQCPKLAFIFFPNRVEGTRSDEAQAPLLVLFLV